MDIEDIFDESGVAELAEDELIVATAYAVAPVVLHGEDDVNKLAPAICVGFKGYQANGLPGGERQIGVMLTVDIIDKLFESINAARSLFEND